MLADIENKNTTSVIISASTSPDISFVGHQNSVPFIQELRLINNSDSDLVDLTLIMETDLGFTASKTWKISFLGLKDELAITDRDTTLNSKFLLDLVEQMKGSVTFILKDETGEIARVENKVRVLARNQWGGISGQAELLAAFSMPNDPQVDSLVSRAIEILRRNRQGSTLNGYSSKNRDSVWRQVSAIWSAVVGMRLKYHIPPKDFGSVGQKIRLPSSIAASSLATCLDSTMLFCSIMEQAGLHPFVVLQKEHAFAGVWLQPDSFGDLPMEDVSSLRKRRDLKELIVFETTLAMNETPVAFSSAVKEASQSLSENQEDQFEMVIDINRARSRRILPLSLKDQSDKTANKNEEEVDFILPVEDPIESFGDYSNEEENSFDEGQQDRIDIWQRKLLDLSLRNPLLNFKETKTNIKIICPDPGLLEDKLADGKKINFQPLPDLEPSGRDSSIHSSRTGEDIVVEHSKKGLEARNPILYVKEDPKTLKSRLTELYRKAKNDLEEGGTNTLFLSIGTLSYTREDRKGQKYRAPLILVPVEIKRKSIKSSLQIVLHDDEPRFNTTLLQFLKQDFGLDIPGFDGSLPEDESGVDVDGIWNAVRKKVVDLEGFEVKEDVYIGTFSFAKYLMWKDLVDRTEMLKDNPVVRHLIDREGTEAYQANSEGIPDKQRLDEVIDPSNLYTPLPADSSQLLAVVAAEKGEDFIMDGPPGTGKSQTISNIIVQLLATDKKVLFVSEKAAALNVVYKRLTDIGLGDYCLELHSNKAKKADVINQFNVAWQSAIALPSSEWKNQTAHLKSLRDSLNEYVAALHEEHKNGLTVYAAIGHVTKNKDLPHISLSYPSSDQHSKDEFAQLIETVHQLRINAEILEDLKNKPLTFINNHEWSNAWQNQIAQSSKALVSSAILLSKITKDCVEVLGNILGDLNLSQLHSLKVASEALLQSHMLDVSFAVDSGAQEVNSALEKACLLLPEYAAETKRLSVLYKEDAWKSVDTEDYRTQMATAEQYWWPKSTFSKNKVLKNFMLTAGTATKPNFHSDLSVFAKLREIGEKFEKLEPIVSQLGFWNGYKTEVSDIEEYLGLAKKLQSSIPILCKNTDQLLQFKQKLKEILGHGKELLSSDGSIGSTLTRFIETYNEFSGGLDNFSADASRSPDDIYDINDESLEGLIGACNHILENQARLNDWCAWQAIKRDCIAFGLEPVVKCLEDGMVPRARIEDLALSAYCSWWASEKMDKSDVLRTFNSRSHADKISSFQQLDDEYRALSAKYVKAKICTNLPGRESVRRNSEEGKIRHLTTQKRPRKAVRKIIEESPNFITNLTPCVLMSPLSIAQYLPADFQAFDVVIFDEASQITVWDAVGSIARARQTIIAGDPKQMPPSNNFGRNQIDDDLGEEEGDLESILDEMIAAGIPKRSLNWHYRSKNESLITFSNHNYYKGQLITFPSPATEDKAVSLVRVDGIYASGQGRTNLIEARAVVEKVKEKLLDADFNYRNLSLGIVTFNADQQHLIQDLLDKERQNNSLIEKHFSDEKSEAVFVKNLENVQGDERDIIIFSMTFGKKAEGGRMSMNFGPMNKVGGERRLNVAITRAREEMIVFSSFDADEIDLSRTSAVGVAHLKAFVDYAARGTQAIRDINTGSVGGFDSPFEEAVADALRKKGWIIHPQIGVSAFRVDLGVVHPEFPGAYLAGIECDGATYHSSATARDRDKIREGILQGLGWNLIRIWSTDFWIDAEREIELVDQKLRLLLKEDMKNRAAKSKQKNFDLVSADIVVDISRDLDDEDAQTDVVEEMIPLTSSEDEGDRKEPLVAKASLAEYTNDYSIDEYEVFTEADLTIELKPDLFYEDHYQATLFGLMKQILNKEAPIYMIDLMNRVARLHGFQKTGNRINVLLSKVLSSGFKRTSEAGRYFVWNDDQEPELWSTARTPANEESKRDVGKICLQELTAFAKAHKGHSNPLEAIRNDLGFARLSQEKKERIEKVLNRV